MYSTSTGLSSRHGRYLVFVEFSILLLCFHHFCFWLAKRHLQQVALFVFREHHTHCNIGIRWSSILNIPDLNVSIPEWTRSVKIPHTAGRRSLNISVVLAWRSGETRGDGGGKGREMFCQTVDSWNNTQKKTSESMHEASATPPDCAPGKKLVGSKWLYLRNIYFGCKDNTVIILFGF